MALHPTVAYRAEHWRSSVLDFKTTGSTEIVPARSGKRFMPLLAWVEYTNPVAVTLGPTFNLGNNATAYDNVHQGSSVAYPVADYRRLVLIPLFVSGGQFTVDVGSTGIFVKITVAATGTTVQGVVILEGYYY